MAADIFLDFSQENFFECSLPEHSKVYHLLQEAVEGGESA